MATTSPQGRFDRESIKSTQREIAAKAAEYAENPEVLRVSDDLNRLVLSLAHAEGYVTVWETHDQALRHPKGGAEAAQKQVVALLLAGADDGWSGRGNDVRRAHYDGMREAANELRWSW